MKSEVLSRTRMVFLLVLLGAGIILVKLFFLQIKNGESYRERADRQYVSPSSGVFERGTIYFSRRDGSLISAAAQASGYKLVLNPKEIKSPEDAYEKISRIIPLHKEEFLAKAKKIDDPYEEAARRLSKAQADRINALNIGGVSLYRDKWRFYPGGSLASQVLGFVGYRGDVLDGRYGLERSYNEILFRPGDNPYVNFFAEIFAGISRVFSDGPEAGDLITTLEPETQGFLEESLRDVALKRSAESLGGIIMNPVDGSLYAVSGLPDFDPNDFSVEGDISVFKNPLVENVFEFGSVVKPLVMAAALDAGAVTADTRYDDRGFVRVEGKDIYNFDKKGRGVVDMQTVLGQSLNTGMVFAYQKLGREKMREYMLSYGINEKTGVDLPGEAKNLVGNFLGSPREIEYANASFGQGIALSPISLVRALSSLANGGTLVTPHAVDRIKHASGAEKKIEYSAKLAKISPATSVEITRMLVNVTDKFLGGGKFSLPHHSVAAKTGTAQIANLESGGYYADRYMHSFFGYFPAYDPKFIIFLYAINPKGVRYASETWAEPFMNIVKFLINYYAVPPDR